MRSTCSAAMPWPSSFTLTRKDLSEVSSVDLEGQRVILSIFPSLDTSTCAESVRKFNHLTADLQDAVMLCVSMDLPFAQSQFCGAEHLERVVTASAFRHLDFGTAFGATIIDGPMRGLLARAVVALDENGTVVHTELVSELTREPDYDLAIHAVRRWEDHEKGPPLFVVLVVFAVDLFLEVSASPSAGRACRGSVRPHP